MIPTLLGDIPSHLDHKFGNSHIHEWDEDITEPAATWRNSMHTSIRIDMHKQCQFLQTMHPLHLRTYRFPVLHVSGDDVVGSYSRGGKRTVDN